MVPFLHFQFRELEGVVSVTPSDGLSPGTVFALSPACTLGIVNRPINLQRLARVGILRLVRYDVRRDGDIAAVLVLNDQTSQSEAVRFCTPVIALRSANCPSGQMVPFLYFQFRELEGVVSVAPSDGLSPGTVFALGPTRSLRIVDRPVDPHGFARRILRPDGVQVDALAGPSQVKHLLAALIGNLTVLTQSPALEHVPLTSEGIRIFQRDVLSHVGGRGGLILLRISGDIAAVAVVHDGVLVGGNFIHLSVKLILLQDQGQSRLLAFVADVLRFLVPTVKGVARFNGRIIERIGFQILCGDIVSDAH